MKSNEVPSLTHLICNVKNIGYDDLVPIILHYATDRRIGKYCLQKDYKFNQSIPVRILPEQYLRYDDINFDNLISMKFGELFSRFANVILSKFHYVNLTNFYNNLNEIRIDLYDLRTKNKYFHRGIFGYYDVKKNAIKLDEDYVSVIIFHELFHMASSVYLNGNYYSGFRQYSSDDYTSIGKGLNEGYTQLLTERYFGHNDDFGKVYEYETFIAGKLEEIVGKFKMQELYLSANLYGLIKELNRYVSYEEIINFIRCLDFLNNNLNNKTMLIFRMDTIVKRIKIINSFLVKAYLIKLKKEEAYNILSNDNVVIKFDRYIDSLLNDYYNENFDYYKISRDGIISDLDNILDLVSDSKRGVHKR